MQPSKPIRRPVQIPIETHSTLKMESARRDVPMGELVRLATEAYVGAATKEAKPKRKRASLSA